MCPLIRERENKPTRTVIERVSATEVSKDKRLVCKVPEFAHDKGGSTKGLLTCGGPGHHIGYRNSDEVQVETNKQSD
jgi:hypothetical protein